MIDEAGTAGHEIIRSEAHHLHPVQRIERRLHTISLASSWRQIGIRRFPPPNLLERSPAAERERSKNMY